MSTQPLQVAILVFDEVEALDLGGPYEVFTTASRMHQRQHPDATAPFVVQCVARSLAPVRARAGLRVLPDADFASAAAPDVLIVPGGVVDAAAACPATRAWVAQAAGSAQITASVCTGAFILAAAGVLTEGPAIVQYLADQKPDAGLLAPAGSLARARAQEWLNYIATELHKNFGALFRPGTAEEVKEAARATIAQRLTYTADALQVARDGVAGGAFGVEEHFARGRIADQDAGGSHRNPGLRRHSLASDGFKDAADIGGERLGVLRTDLDGRHAVARAAALDDRDYVLARLVGECELGAQKIGSADITSFTDVCAGACPSAIALITMSRSVTTPTRREPSPCTTGIAPTS